MFAANEYQELALRTANPDLSPSQSLQEGLMGLCGEAGECVDILKKYLFQGHAELDIEHLAEELGDVAWYLAISAAALGYDLEEIFKINIEKLQKRYPNGFEAERSVNRGCEIPEGDYRIKHVSNTLCETCGEDISECVCGVESVRGEPPKDILFYCFPCNRSFVRNTCDWKVAVENSEYNGAGYFTACPQCGEECYEVQC